MQFRAGRMKQSVGLGQLILEAARGGQERRPVPAADVQALNKEIADRVTPRIEKVRDDQRRALEDSKPLVLL